MMGISSQKKQSKRRPVLLGGVFKISLQDKDSLTTALVIYENLDILD